METLQITSVYDTPVVRQHISTLEKLGIQCDVISATGISVDDNNEGLLSPLKSAVIGHNPVYYGFCAAKFYPQILTRTALNEYDLVHVTSGVIAPFSFLQSERPIVLTLKGSDLLGDRWFGFQSHLSEICANHSDATIVMSEEMSAKLDGNAVVIPPGIDLEKFKPSSQYEAIRQLGWDDDKFHILFPYARSRPEKRYELAKHVVDIVGDRTTHSLKLHAVTGEPHSKIPIYMNASDVLLLTSTHEGSPTTVKEALACNLPVVSTNVGDVSERLEPVSNSYVCESDGELVEALVMVLESGERSDGREYVEEVSLERMGERIINVYESVLE